LKVAGPHLGVGWSLLGQNICRFWLNLLIFSIFFEKLKIYVTLAGECRSIKNCQITIEKSSKQLQNFNLTSYSWIILFKKKYV
jgi:hypothetical protein